MIGHNPSTPAGAGQAVGKLLSMDHLEKAEAGVPYILAVSKAYPYETVAKAVNELAKVLTITGLILQADEAVLVYNRLDKKLPIIDEVKYIEKVCNRSRR